VKNAIPPNSIGLKLSGTTYCIYVLPGVKKNSLGIVEIKAKNTPKRTNTKMSMPPSLSGVLLLN
jgi:hypothetical protein